VKIEPIDAARTQPGERRRRLTDLSPRERTVFDAQAEAWAAACEFIREVDAQREVGRHASVEEATRHQVSVHEAEAHWVYARDRLRWARGQRAQ
jgi:hypothetical protein